MLKPLAIATVLLHATAAIASADILWGANGHPFTAYPGIGFDRQLDYLKDLGMKSYRVNISYAASADRLAGLVAEGKKRGIDILPVITPSLDLDQESSENLYRKARKLAFHLGVRFKADIRVWELGNELENYAIIKACEMRDDGSQYSCEWGPASGSGALDYYGPRWAKASAVLKGLSDGMTEADPTIRKAMGTAGWGHTGAFERMRQDGIKWDISVWHMYGEDPEWAFKKLAVYGRPIWVTEFNNLHGSESGEEQQVEGVTQTMRRLRELQVRYRVEAAHIYELLDEPYWAPDFEAVMGLVRLTGSAETRWRLGEPKPAYGAVRDLIRGESSPMVPPRGCDLAGMEAVDPLALRQVNFGYCLMLGRSPGSGEADRRAKALADGETTFMDMLVSMLRSREFVERYSSFGMTDRTYVGFLYPLLLGREADGYGLDSYARQLRDGSMTRDDVAIAMMASNEFTTKYSGILKADGDVRSPKMRASQSSRP